jgi:DNA modification methylase
LIEINKIHNEDCITYMSKLPPKSVKLIISDPPYNIGQDDGDGWDTIDNY